jgi:hypothetical protein
MNYRDFLARPEMVLPEPDPESAAKWSEVLATNSDLDEADSLAMLRDFDIPASNNAVIHSVDALMTAAGEMQYPLVLKTAERGIIHKSEHRGVVLNLADEQALSAAYADLATRLGPRALLAEMAGEGIEMILGVQRDPQYGPIVMLGFGGVLAEVLKDVAFALPPFDATYAKRLLGGLSLRPLLDGVRGRQPVAIDQFCHTAAKFSVMVDALRDQLQEVDINPVIVTQDGCIAVDALVVGRVARQGE